MLLGAFRRINKINKHTKIFTQIKLRQQIRWQLYLNLKRFPQSSQVLNILDAHITSQIIKFNRSLSVKQLDLVQQFQSNKQMQKEEESKIQCYFCYPTTQQHRLISKALIKMIKNKLKAINQHQNRELTFKQNKFKVALSSFSRNNSRCSHKRLYSLFKDYSQQVVEKIAQRITENIAERSYQLQTIENQVKNLASSIPSVASQMAQQKYTQAILKERANFQCLDSRKELVQKQEFSQVKFSQQISEYIKPREEQLQQQKIKQQRFNSDGNYSNPSVYFPMNLFFHFQP